MDLAAASSIEPATDGRTRIVRSARQLFTRTGFKTVSMQQIADAAGVNKATLYHHFADKEDLFVEVLRQEFEQAHGQLNASIAGCGSLRAQLIHIALHIFSTHHADIGRLMSDLREHVSEQRREELLSRVSPPWISIKTIFEQAQARGEITNVDATLVGRLFFVMAASQLGWSKFGAAEVQPDEHTAATLADILLNGISRHPDSPAAPPDPASRP